MMERGTEMIEFRNVKKIYPGNQVAVTDINLKFNTGEFICFIGLSGSGKTTCMRMINRMNELTEGEILIDGINIKDINPTSRHLFCFIISVFNKKRKNESSLNQSSFCFNPQKFAIFSNSYHSF